MAPREAGALAGARRPGRVSVLCAAIRAWLEVGERLELECIDSPNKRRRYAMSVIDDPQLALFGAEPRALVLVVARGRIGRPNVVVRTRFEDMSKLARKWRELVALRRRHGYVEVSR